MNGDGYEYAQHVNPEPHGPTYDIVMSERGTVDVHGDSHWTGNLLPSTHSRSDERAHAFWDGSSVMDQ